MPQSDMTEFPGGRDWKVEKFVKGGMRGRVTHRRWYFPDFSLALFSFTAAFTAGAMVLPSPAHFRCQTALGHRLRARGRVH